MTWGQQGEGLLFFGMGIIKQVCTTDRWKYSEQTSKLILLIDGRISIPDRRCCWGRLLFWCLPATKPSEPHPPRWGLHIHRWQICFVQSSWLAVRCKCNKPQSVHKRYSPAKWWRISFPYVLMVFRPCHIFQSHAYGIDIPSRSSCRRLTVLTARQRT